MDTGQEKVRLFIHPHQVSGKQPKLLTEDRTKILKGLNTTQHQFYLQVFQLESHHLQRLKPFLPTFYGILQLKEEPQLLIESQSDNEWLSHLGSRYKERNQSNAFIILENLTLNYQRPCIFDIKIGGRNVEGKKHKITKSVSEYSIKLNGCKLVSIDGKDILFSKYFLGSVVQFKDMSEFLALFMSKGNKIQLQMLEVFIVRLKEIAEHLKEVRGYRFISSSLCIMYDYMNSTRIDVRLIDFGRLTKENPVFCDEESYEGVLNVVKILQGIASNSEDFQKGLAIRDKHLQSEVMYIPEHKKVKVDPSNV